MSLISSFMTYSTSFKRIDTICCWNKSSISSACLWSSRLLLALSHLAKSPSDNCFLFEWPKLHVGSQSTLCSSQRSAGSSTKCLEHILYFSNALISSYILSRNSSQISGPSLLFIDNSNLNFP